MSKHTASIVVALVLLASVGAVAGAAAATTHDDRRDAETRTVASAVAEGPSTVVHDLDSEGSYWSGSRLQFDAGGVLPDDASAADRTFELWRVSEDGRLSQRVRTVTVAENGTHRIETAGLAGRYAVRYGERIVYVYDGVGYLESPPDGNPVTVATSAFEIERQTLDASWSDPTVYPGQRVTLAVTSNRDDYAVAVSGANLSFRNLTDAFPASAYAENYAARADEDVLLVSAGARSSYRLETSSFEPGDGSLTLDVVDTATRRTAALSVERPDDDMRFVSVEREENVGDVVEANLSCTHCYLVAGGPGQGFLDVVELTDANGDGYVVVRANTRYVGMNPGEQGYPSSVEAYTSPEDSVDRYASSATLEELDDTLTYSYTQLSDLRAQQELEPSGRTRPIGPGEVELTVADSDFVIDRSAWGSQEPHGGQVVVRDEADVRTVQLEPRRLDGVEVMAAPGGARLPPDVEELRAIVGPRDRVALGDHLVFRFDVSGLFGYLQTRGADVTAVQDNRAEGIDLTLEGLEDGGGTTTYRLDHTAVGLYSDPSTDSLYVAVQTGGTSRANLQMGQYRATLVLSGVDGKHDEYSTVHAYGGNPYVAPGETETVSGTATVRPPTASIESPSVGSAPRLNTDSQLVVRGTTSYAPGGTLRVEAAATEYAWEASTAATINETGRWTGTLPLEGAPGEEFTVTVVREGTQFAERTYTVRPPPVNESEGGNTSDGGGGQSGSDGSSGPLGDAEEGGILSSLPGLSGLAGPIGGGVGVLLFVWAGWRLVIRRLLL